MRILYIAHSDKTMLRRNCYQANINNIKGME